MGFAAICGNCTNYIEALKFNTAIAALMTMMNEVSAWDKISRPVLEDFLKILSPFAPHLSEELWQLLGHKRSIMRSSWPEHDEKLCQESEVEVGVQVDGKVRGRFMISSEASEDELKSTALEVDTVMPHLEGKKVQKVIVIKGRLVSIVTK